MVFSRYHLRSQKIPFITVLYKPPSYSNILQRPTVVEHHRLKVNANQRPMPVQKRAVTNSAQQQSYVGEDVQSCQQVIDVRHVLRVYYFLQNKD